VRDEKWEVGSKSERTRRRKTKKVMEEQERQRRMKTKGTMRGGREVGDETRGRRKRENE
jgi:hypothetical protein